MSSNHDATSPTTEGTPRLEPDHVLHRELTVMLWLMTIGGVLALLGTLIALVSPPSATTWSGVKVGILIASLSFQPFVTIPGVLVALRHPWGGGFRREWDRRFAHPRAVGCAEIWAGLLVSGCLDILLFAPVRLFLGVVVMFAVCMVAIAPLVVLVLFGRPH